MSLHLIASIPEDGFAIINDGGAHFLIRPPYHLASRIALIPADIDEAVAKHDFTAEDAEFSGYSALIEYLEDRLEKVRRASGLPIEPDLPLVELLGMAPPETITLFLSRAEKELIPKRQWDHAEDLLLNILAARSEGFFKQEAGRMLQISHNARHAYRAWSPRDARFRTAETEMCHTIARTIRQNRRILEPAA